MSLDNRIPPEIFAGTFEQLNGLGAMTGMQQSIVRTFGTATRNPLGNKIQYFGPDGLLSIPALRAYGRYMRTHRQQADGTLRNYNNWRQGDGIPQSVCIDSLSRHMIDLAELLEGADVCDEDGNEVTLTDACCAILFNAFSILHVEVTQNG